MTNSMNNNKTQIVTLGVNNGFSGGYTMLPLIENTNEITNTDMVWKIYIEGSIDELFEQMPKSHGWKKGSKWDSANNVSISLMYIVFNTFWMDGNTGEVNETAIKKRLKVIEKLKSLGY
jgi:hypothetical protein